MNILFTICARAGSKGFKSKNTKLFLGYPLVDYSLAAYQLFRKQCDNTWNVELAVNTDSKQLLEQIFASKVEFIKIERKADLAGDRVSKMSVICDTWKKAEQCTGKNFDIVVDLDITSPLRTVQDISGTIKKLLENEEADLAFSVTESRRSPYFNMVCLKEDGYYNRVFESDFVSRQQTPECFDMNASIYAYRKEYLMTKNEMVRKAVIWKMYDTAVLDIDGENDLKLMEIIAKHLFDGKVELRKIYEWVCNYCLM